MYRSFGDDYMETVIEIKRSPQSNFHIIAIADLFFFWNCFSLIKVIVVIMWKCGFKVTPKNQQVVCNAIALLYGKSTSIITHALFTVSQC